MVEKIAVCWWRQKRALRYEALMIRGACLSKGRKAVLVGF